MTPKEHVEYIANAIEKSKAFLNSGNLENDLKLLNTKIQSDTKFKDRFIHKQNVGLDKEIIPNKDRFYSPGKIKQRKVDLQDTYNKGLNHQFEILHKLKQKLQRRHIKTYRSNDLEPLNSEWVKSTHKHNHDDEFSDRKILKLSKREDVLSNEEISKINKRKQDLMGAKYFFCSQEAKQRVDAFIGQEPKSVEKLHYYKKYINRNNPVSLKSGRRGSKERKLSQSSNKSNNNSK